MKCTYLGTSKAYTVLVLRGRRLEHPTVSASSSEESITYDAFGVWLEIPFAP